MSTPTPFLQLIKAAIGEPYDISIVNNNLDAIDNAFPRIDYMNSTYKDTNWDMTNCKFTRFRMGNLGIVVCEISVGMKAIALPVNTAAPIELSEMVPAGYRPVNQASLPLQMANLANSGAGQLVQVGVKNTSGIFQIRSAGSAFTPVAGCTLTWSTAYRWDGVL